MKKKMPFALWLLIVTLLGALLRAALLNIGLTIDDACTADVVEASTISDLFLRIKVYEMSPPLYFLILKGFTSLFGLSALTMALPSMLFGTINIVLTALLARKVTAATVKVAPSSCYAERTALLAAFFQAVSPLAIIYSHEARTYALAGCLLTLCAYYFIDFFSDSKAAQQSNNKQKPGRLLPLFLSGAALVYTHYTAIIYLLVFALLALVFQFSEGKEDIKPIKAVAPIGLALASLAPWLPILNYHKAVGTPWADPTPIANFAHVFLGNLAGMMPLPVVPAYLSISFVVLPALLLLAFIKRKASAKLLREKLSNPVILTLLLPLIGTCATIGYITPYMFGYVRYLSPLVPFSSILAALAAAHLVKTIAALRGRKHFKREAISALLLFLPLALGGAIFEVSLLAKQPRSGLRPLAKEIANKEPIYTDAVIWTAPDFVGMILSFYLKHDNKIITMPDITGFACPDSGHRPIMHEEDVNVLKEPNLWEKHKKLIDEKKAAGARRLIFVRDTYKPSSKLMPVKEIDDSFEEKLKQNFKVEAVRTYKGSAGSYDVTVFSLSEVKE
ncbi:MAG: glycosyltransferase family 39 protein [Candidatus Obscuribacterales bacterium]|nr:glycosyltransferase family 39 protein [Candidatus Obscuribacterales bacterium]